MENNKPAYAEVIIQLQQEKDAVRNAGTAGSLRQSVEKVEGIVENSVDRQELEPQVAGELEALVKQMRNYREELQHVEDERISEFDNQVITTIGSMQYSLWEGNAEGLFRFVTSR